MQLKESSTTHIKSENDLIQSTRTANSILNEQFQLKQLMMEKQLELLHKQVGINRIGTHVRVLTSFEHLGNSGRI